MPRTIIKLTDFDPQPIIEYAISSTDITNVYHYLLAMQRDFWPGTWEDICVGGYYGTSALLHEVVELRILLRRDPYLIGRSEQHIKNFARTSKNHDAHLRGLEAEYGYLQRSIFHLYHKQIDVGALLKANSRRPGDWNDLFETDLAFFDPSSAAIQEAREILIDLRKQKVSKL